MDNLMGCFLDALKTSIRNGSVSVEELPEELKIEVQPEAQETKIENE